MLDVFENGTARSMKLEHISQCGKTGTAQNPHGQDHSIFVSFAPKDDPKIAIAVIIENGYWGSRWAAPISSLMTELYLTDTITRKTVEQRMLNGTPRRIPRSTFASLWERQHLSSEFLMAYLSNNRNRVGFDWILVSLYFLLCIWGWISIYAAVYNEESASIFSLDRNTVNKVFSF